MIIASEVRKGNHTITCEDNAIVSKHIINDEAFSTNECNPFIVGIADGVGGNPGGDEASNFILKQVSSLELPATETAIRDRLIVLNDELLRHAASQPEKSRMATTLTAILKNDNNYFLIHVGNTRVYSSVHKYLSQMTVDNTMYQKYLNTGQFESAESSTKSILSGCFGAGKRELIMPLVVKQVFTNNVPETILLTSDGVHDYVSQDKLEELCFLNEKSDIIVRKIIDEACCQGSTDDKSVILIRMKEERA